MSPEQLEIIQQRLGARGLSYSDVFRHHNLETISFERAQDIVQQSIDLLNQTDMVISKK